MKLYYSSGKLYAQINEADHTYYYPDGILKTLEPYRDGKLHGEVFLYWPTGRIKRKCFFLQGLREGLDQMWNEEGRLVDEGGYERAKSVGVHRRWSGLGNVIEEVTYIDSVRFNFHQWDELGQLRFEGIWINDSYFEKIWDRFDKAWIEKRGFWNGQKLIYI